MSQFFSGQLSQLAPYTPGEQPKDKNYVKLNANESPYPPSPGVAAALNAREAAGLRLYSDATATELKTALASQYGVGPENVFVSNGSDEALNFAFLAYATDGRGAAFADLTYSFYPVFCDLYHIQADVIPLKEDFSLDPRDYYGRNQTIVIANPNAPTGLALSRDEVEGIVKANPDSVVVVDEALLSAVDVTAGLKKEGAIVINSGKSPAQLRPLLKGYAGRVFTIDAGRISEEELGKNFPNTPMLAAIVKVSGVVEPDAFVKDMEASFHHKFASKPQVIEGNMRALKRSMEEVQAG